MDNHAAFFRFDTCDSRFEPEMFTKCMRKSKRQTLISASAAVCLAIRPVFLQAASFYLSKIAKITLMSQSSAVVRGKLRTEC